MSRCSLLVFALAGTLTAGEQGPQPGVRLVIDAFTKAVISGSADQYESMARAHFAPELLATQTPAERAARFKALADEFGTITIEGVRRQGPGAPLDVIVKGSKASGAIVLELEPAAPFRVTRVAVRVGGAGPDQPSIPPPPINARMSTQQLTLALDAYLAKTRDLSGVVAVAKDGKTVFEKAYGLANRSARVPNTTATRFNIGSINKLFTQIAIAQLVSAGRLSYDDTLGKLIPDYPQEQTRAATIQQLLDHTAGIADFFGDDFNRQPKDRFRTNVDYYRYVSGKPPLFEPGARNEYCNGCYITLGEVAARVSGMSYERFVAENIFTPSGMTTGFPQSDGVEPNIAEGYTARTPDASIRRNIFMHGAGGSAAGGAYATAADLIAIDNAIRERRLFGEQELARRFGAAASKPGRVMGEYGIAGGAPGTNASLESDGVWTVVVLTNFDPPLAGRIGQAILMALK